MVTSWLLETRWYILSEGNNTGASLVSHSAPTVSSTGEITKSVGISHTFTIMTSLQEETAGFHVQEIHERIHKKGGWGGQY